MANFFLTNNICNGYKLDMYLRTTQRRNRDGTTVEYVSLAHNRWDPVAKRAQAEVLYHFGRREEVDVEALRRLVRSINRFLGLEDELASEVTSAASPLRWVESRPMGGAWLLRKLWERIGADKDLMTLARRGRFEDPEAMEGAIFAMVANRCLRPLSKHATGPWLETGVYAPGVPERVYDEQLYRAMDFLLGAEEEIQKSVFFSTADLLRLDVDLLLYDTTSSYFEMGGPISEAEAQWAEPRKDAPAERPIDGDDDEDLAERAERAERWEVHLEGAGPEPTRPKPQVVSRPPLRLQGHSKDHRPDAPQVVIGMVVTREGIPVRCFVFPGNTNDAETIQTVKESLTGWRLNRVVWAVDRGMVSDENLRELRKGGAHYVAGEKMRAGRKEVEEALSRPGRYHAVRDHLEVKEVVVGDGARRKRYVLVRNPAQVHRDREDRERLLKRIEAALVDLPEGGEEHSKAVCRLFSHPTMGRFLTQDRKGRPVIDRAKVKAEERLDGKYLIVTSDDTMTAEDVALGYKQWAEIERAWRDMKSGLDLWPMYHRKSDRIRAHVLLCWLALLLTRAVEVRTGETWSRVHQEMDRLHRGVFVGKDGLFVQRTEVTPLQHRFFKAVGVPPPPRFLEITPSELRVAGEVG